MKRLFITLFFLLSLAALSAQRSYTLIVSMDGFRWDYSLMYRTPFLDSLSQAGVYAQMRPSFPSKTFPNHYTICTGLVPDHHGIIANKFYHRERGVWFSLNDPETKFDGSFYGGEPIWVTAHKQGKKVGVIYWPGSDTEIQGIRPDYYHKYVKGELLTYPERLDAVERFFNMPEEERPDLVMLYFDEPDHDGHFSNPYSPQTRATVERMDSIMSDLYHMIKRLPIGDRINLIITSDHGMAPTSPKRLVKISDYIKPEWVEYYDYSLPTMIEAKPGCADSILAVLSDVPHIRAWRKGEVPEYLQFGTNPNCLDIIVNPDLGWVIGDVYALAPGQHGYDPYENDMQVTFRAIGPAFKSGYKKEALFQNTAIYPLLCHLMDITPAPNDGLLDFVKELLKEDE